jgi:hypothetical protein
VALEGLPMKSTIGLLSVLLVSLITIFSTFNVHNFYAYWWKAENATVTLNNCSGDCELTGTLRIEPWTGNHLLEEPDGSITTLQEGMFSAISYPADNVE